MVAMRSFVARTYREPPWWIIEVKGVGTTQARSLSRVEVTAADMISGVLDLPIDHIQVEVVAELDPQLNAEIDELRAAIVELEARQAETARRSRGLVRRLTVGMGLKGREAALLLGISPQRVSQLMRG